MTYTRHARMKELRTSASTLGAILVECSLAAASMRGQIAREQVRRAPHTRMLCAVCGCVALSFMCRISELL